MTAFVMSHNLPLPDVIPAVILPFNIPVIVPLYMSIIVPFNMPVLPHLITTSPVTIPNLCNINKFERYSILS